MEIFVSLVHFRYPNSALYYNQNGLLSTVVPTADNNPWTFPCPNWLSPGQSVTPASPGPGFQVLVPAKKSNTEWCWTFLAGALGLEFQVSGIYGVFETFVFLKHHFHPIYSIIFNCSFCVFPLKGNRKGKNMGNKQVLTTPQYTRVWASQLINRDAHKKGGRRILCNFTEIRSYQA